MRAVAEEAATDPASPPEDEAGRKTRLEKVVVTANKREQLLTDVPMSVSAISGAALEKEGDRTFADYAQKIPALNLGYYGEGRQRINLRGLQAPTGVATVAYLVDGIEQGDSPPDPDLFDIDHIEVLRGPQGTLYGAGAVGGAIKIQTNRANPYGFQSKFLGSAAYNAAGAWQQDGNVMANVPLIQGELGARVVAFVRHADGYVDVREPDYNNLPPLRSYSSTNVIADKANTTDVAGGRLAVDWRATSDVTLGAKYMVEQSRINWGPAQDVDFDERYGGYNMVQGCACALSGDITNHDYRQSTFNLNWRLPFAQLESVTGTADVKEDLGSPLFIVLPLVDTVVGIGGVPLPVPLPTLPPALAQILDAAGLPTQAAIGDMFEFRLLNQYSYVSQEVRLVGEPGRWFPFTWTAGLFYKLTNREAFEEVFAGPNLGNPLLAPVLNPDGGPFDEINLHFRTEEYAAYGQLEYAITDKLTALAGARYYRASLVDSAEGGGADGTFTPRFHDVSPKFTLSYHFTDTMLAYASAAKGFRIGGVNFSTLNPSPPNFQRTYDPDVLWNYEIGLNSVLLDGRLSANFAVFDCRWSNLQDEVLVRSSASAGGGGVEAGGQERMVINAGKAYSRGVEGELTALLPLDLSWSVSGAYLDAAIGQDQANPATGGVIPKGTPLENVPHFAGSSTLSHDLLFSGGWGIATGVTYTYRGRTHSDITNPGESRAKPYHLLDARIGVHGKAQAWSVDLFANNVLNARAASFSFQNSGTPNSIPFRVDVPLPYRTIGLRLALNFR